MKLYLSHSLHWISIWFLAISFSIYILNLNPLRARSHISHKHHSSTRLYLILLCGLLSMFSIQRCFSRFLPFSSMLSLVSSLPSSYMNLYNHLYELVYFRSRFEWCVAVCQPPWPPVEGVDGSSSRLTYSGSTAGGKGRFQPMAQAQCINSQWSVFTWLWINWVFF